MHNRAFRNICSKKILRLRSFQIDNPVGDRKYDCSANAERNGTRREQIDILTVIWRTCACFFFGKNSEIAVFCV